MSPRLQSDAGPTKDPARSQNPVGAFIFDHTWKSWEPAALSDACQTLTAAGVTRFMTETWELEQRVIDVVRDHGMEFWTSVACFSDHNDSTPLARADLVPVLANGEPRPKMEWYQGLIPTDADYNEALVNRCGEMAATFDVDGFCLDFIRWPLHWELELRPGATRTESSFDATTLAAYRDVSDLPAGLSASEAASWIERNDLEGWVGFKCDTIETVVSRTVAAITSASPEISTGLFVVPGEAVERRRLLGQDTKALSRLVDELLPMVYHRIVHRDPAWIGRIAHDIRQTSSPSSRIVPVVQVSAESCFAGDADWGSALDSGEHQDAIDMALGGGDGVVIFPGEALLTGASTVQIKRALAAAAPSVEA